MPDDILYMRRALRLAAKGLGKVAPNPLVGCVIVKHGKIIADGWHKEYGREHAEVVALKQAGAKAKGAVMYVTLEPCAHWGHTPPCVEAVLAAGLKKVVIAMVDPNRLTRGKSVKKLRAAGVEVIMGVGELEARELNAGFIKYISRRMPYVTAKTAQTLDGRIAARSGDSKWITSSAAREISREKRNNFAAILVGVGTVLADDPGLDAPAKPIIKIVVDSGLRTPEKARLFHGTVAGQVILAVTDKAPKAKICRLERRGVVVICCPKKEGKVDLVFLFKALASRYISSILIEGGAAVIGSALKAGLVDELNIYLAPRILGDDQARASVSGLEALNVAQARNFCFTKVERIGSDLFLILKHL
ncbi:MAG: bifunctional diaminohydroxyphosphoribosylaminopyrimidine deaminase/5-amino-6-(5-phosphoribosylamino)uracil reductase RibD [Candidatus Omnitrophica bacterium]|nr:bifunctional diaminohydroxyphosphoribosylaminopyrimidine deaminase/5-amino-6-(5-phosphoribosylamino)uracil reductase RibD [Candidatus Omnitrophota bacterium]